MPNPKLDLIAGSNHLHLTEINIEAIQLPARELRSHPQAQIDKIAKSLETFGWMSPMLVSADKTLIAGSARLRAAKQLGLKTAPVIEAHQLSDAEIRAYRIADNRLSEESDWNRKELQLELSELLELDIDVEVTGFEVGEIDVLLDEQSSPEPAQVDSNPTQAPVSRIGDVWQVGPHTVICGDSLKAETYRPLQDETISAAFTDPPYNVPIKNNVSGLGKAKHGEFLQASGELTDEEFATFLRTAHARLAEHIRPGGVVFSCMDWRNISTLVTEGKRAGFELINMAVWDKGVGGMGALYRSQHELVAVFRQPGAQHRNNVALGKHGRNRTNVWAYPGLNAGAGTRGETLALHPTVKPTALVADALKDVTKHGDLVLDIFGGSGTTMLAAHQCKRRAVLIELDPRYVDVALQRMATEFGLTAVHAETGKCFDEIAAERQADESDSDPSGNDNDSGGIQ